MGLPAGNAQRLAASDIVYLVVWLWQQGSAMAYELRYDMPG